MLPIFQNYAPDVLEQCFTPSKAVLHVFKSNVLPVQKQSTECSKGMFCLFKRNVPCIRKLPSLNTTPFSEGG